MVCTNDAEFYETVRMLRAHGLVRELDSSSRKKEYADEYADLNPEFIFMYPGYNVRGTEINAVIGRSQLPRLDENIRKRNENLFLFLECLDPALYQTDFATDDLLYVDAGRSGGLKIGDEIVVNVLGRDIAATIGNLRSVDWQGLGINFVLVFSPNAFKGAPHTHIATLTESHPDAAGDARIIKSVADAFPTVTVASEPTLFEVRTRLPMGPGAVL